MNRRDAQKYLLLLPAIVYLLAMGIFPLFLSLWNSMHATRGGEYQFVWFRNYFRLPSDYRFVNAIAVTSTVIAVDLLVEMLIGLGMIFLLGYLELKGTRYTVIQTLILLPMMMPPIVVGYTWRLILDPYIGPVNEIITTFGFGTVPFLSQPSTALASVIISSIWYWSPFVIAAFYAGYMSIPKELYEAARVDGSKGWRTHRHVTIPLLKTVIVTVVLLRIMDLLKLFDIVYILTGGGPGTSTEVITMYNYFVAFKFLDTEYGSAISYVVLIVAIVVSTAFSRIVGAERKD